MEGLLLMGPTPSSFFLYFLNFLVTKKTLVFVLVLVIGAIINSLRELKDTESLIWATLEPLVHV